MTYYMDYNITIGEYRLQTLKAVSIKRSVEQLSDTATITLPGTLINDTMEIEDKIKTGDKVTIQLGYNGNLQTEFKGYLKTIKTDNTDITLECEDELYLWNVSLKDKLYNNITLQSLLKEITLQINPNYTIDCDYTFTYSKFTIYGATAIDVLKKIQDETKANIYFKENTLHIHPQYSEGSWSSNTVKYNMAQNVVSADLKYIKKQDQKIKVEISCRDAKGEQQTIPYGEGEKIIKRTINNTDKASLNEIAKNEYNLWCYDGYEGSLTGWLIPYCQPTDKVEIIDNTKQYKNGTYYVIATDVEFSANGARRKVTIGRKTN